MRGIAQTQSGRLSVFLICSMLGLLVAWTNTLIGLQVGSLISTCGLLFMVKFTVHGCLQLRWSPAASLIAGVGASLLDILALFAILLLLLR